MPCLINLNVIIHCRSCVSCIKLCLHLFPVENGASGSWQKWVSKSSRSIFCPNLKATAHRQPNYLALTINWSFDVFTLCIIIYTRAEAVFHVLCFRGGSGFSKRRISSVSATKHFYWQTIHNLTSYVRKPLA